MFTNTVGVNTFIWGDIKEIFLPKLKIFSVSYLFLFYVYF